MSTTPRPLPVAPASRSWWLGALFAPWVAPLALGAAVAISDAVAGRAFRVNAVLEVLVFAFAFGLPLAYAGMWLFGLPLAWWLRRRGRLSAPRLCLVATPLGAGLLAAAFVLFGARLALPVQLGLGALSGLCVAAAFCAICGIGWRARDARPTP